MAGRSPRILLTDKQREVLRRLQADSSCPPSIRQRANIILLAHQKFLNQQIAQQVAIHRNYVGIWRTRWALGQEALVDAENKSDTDSLREVALRLLSDQPRSGRPTKKLIPKST